MLSNALNIQKCFFKLWLKIKCVLNIHSTETLSLVWKKDYLSIYDVYSIQKCLNCDKRIIKNHKDIKRFK